MMKKTVILTTMLLIIGLVMNLSYAQATLITIQNPGFESPWQRNGDYDQNIRGWNIYSENQGTYYTGVWNPTAGDYPDGVPERRNVGYIDIKSGAGIVGFEQTISAGTLTPDATYWLAVDVGNPLWVEDPTNWQGFPGYRIEVLAGGTLLADDDSSLSPEEKQFLTSQVSFIAPSSGDLTIRLLNLNSGTGGREVDFDNVRVSDAPLATPEPATVLLLGAGLIGLAGFGRKKFQKK